MNPPLKYGLGNIEHIDDQIKQYYIYTDYFLDENNLITYITVFIQLVLAALFENVKIKCYFTPLPIPIKLG